MGLLSVEVFVMVDYFTKATAKGLTDRERTKWLVAPTRDLIRQTAFQDRRLWLVLVDQPERASVRWL